MSNGTRRTMGGADAMWLHADRPNHLMVIDGIMWTKEPLDWTRMRETVQERLVDLYPVFRQRPVEATRPWDLPSWEDDPDFSLSHHLHHATLRKPGGDKQLRAFLQKRVSQPFDRNQQSLPIRHSTERNRCSILLLRLPRGSGVSARRCPPA